MGACRWDSMAIMDEHSEVCACDKGSPHLRPGTYGDQVMPTCVGRHNLFSRLVVLVLTGECHSMMVLADVLVHTWGYGGHGRLGYGDLEVQSRLTLLGKGQGVFAGLQEVQVACGGAHTAHSVLPTPYITSGKSTFSAS